MERGIERARKDDDDASPPLTSKTGSGGVSQLRNRRRRRKEHALNIHVGRRRRKCCKFPFAARQQEEGEAKPNPIIPRHAMMPNKIEYCNLAAVFCIPNFLASAAANIELPRKGRLFVRRKIQQ